MRTPTDLPRRRPRTGSRGRVVLVVVVIGLFVLLTSLRGIAGFYTDYLWFESLGLSGVWSGVLGAKLLLVLVFTGAFFAILWVNLFVADRLAPRFRPAGPEEDVVERYHEMVGERTGMVRAGVAGIFALIAGAGVSGQWNEWILFNNAVDFGVKDPQFDTDIGFFVFQLPFLKFLVDWLFASMIIVLVVTAVAHYVNGGIRLQTPAQRVTPQVKAHLSVLLGVLALIKAGGYYLQRFELVFSERGVVKGATYTDVNAQLPALTLLILISLFAFLLFLWNIRQRGWVLPVIAVGLWAFVALVAGTIYPQFIQRFRVEPAESAKERPYISRNIEATRAAMGLDDVEEKTFDADDDLTGADLQNNAQTIANVRLWDPRIVGDTYRRLQEVRDYYAINDVDVDRYDIDGRETQVVLSTRELNRDGVPQKGWEAEHLAYTHGYGMVLSPANAVTENGRPNMLVRDIPLRDEADLGIEKEALYYGEGLGGYAIVNTDRKEINYQDPETGDTTFTSYDAGTGVGMGSFLRQAAFALRFGDINPLISNFLRDDSKILFVRDIRDRVEKVAPFLSYDADAYPVVIDGRVLYVMDAYTTTNRYPYAEEADTGQLTAGSGLDHTFNYVRNSVKVTVDAYSGDVTFYVIDDEDPIVRAYRKAFPDLFVGRDELPEGLEEHFRYPEDLFRVQTNMWGRYHIEKPDDWYSAGDAWNVAQDPGTSGVVPGTQSVDEEGNVVAAREARMDPYYLLMRLPDDEQESFLMLRPFVPASEGDRSKLLTAFMVAKSDPGEYGQLSTYVMPRNDLPDGPAVVAASIQSDEEVSRLETLLGQEGSAVLFGNLLLIPVEQSLLYVRPLYVQAESTKVPELRKVIVSFDGEVVVNDTLRGALIELFRSAPETLEEKPPSTGAEDEIGDELPTDGDDQPEEPTEPEEPTSDDVGELLAGAAEAFEAADAALREGDLSEWAQQIEEAERLVARANELSNPTTTTTESGTA